MFYIYDRYEFDSYVLKSLQIHWGVLYNKVDWLL